ncbi:MAG TPA: hypothetical protein VH797_03485 [Nitrososphaeraceae archaeon]
MAIESDVVEKLTSNEISESSGIIHCNNEFRKANYYGTARYCMHCPNPAEPELLLPDLVN